MTRTRLLPLLGIILILTGCSVERRLYTRGFNLSWGENRVSHARDKRDQKTHSKPVTATIKNDKNTLTASNETNIPIPQHHNGYVAQKTGQIPEDTCDLIELKDKTVIKAKVKEINLYYVVYKKCSDPDGPDHQVPKSTIKQIDFAGGLLQSFNFTGDAEPPGDTVYIEESPEEYVKKDYPMAKHAVIAGGCSFIPVVGWVFAILGIVFGSISLGKIRKYPSKYKGEGKARAGIIMGIIGLVLGFIIFMITVYEELYF